MVKHLPASAGHVGLIPGSERFPREGVGIKNGEIVDYPIDEAVEMKHRHTHGLRDLIDMLQ